VWKVSRRKKVMLGLFKNLFRPSQSFEEEWEDEFVDTREPSKVIIASSMILVAFAKSEKTEIEVSAENMTFIISEFAKSDNWGTDFEGCEYVSLRRRFKVLSRLNSWTNLEEQVGTIHFSQGNGDSMERFVFESRFPVDPEKFYLKKK
jgi:hypothetical protein